MKTRETDSFQLVGITRRRLDKEIVKALRISLL